MKGWVLAVGLAVGGALLAWSPARAQAENQDVGSGGGCGFSIFCGWWYWTIQGANGGVGGAGTCYAGDRNCIPPGAVNPGQPGDPCFNNPYADGCGGSTNWSVTSGSRTGGGSTGGNRNRR